MLEKLVLRFNWIIKDLVGLMVVLDINVLVRLKRSVV